MGEKVNRKEKQLKRSDAVHVLNVKPKGSKDIYKKLLKTKIPTPENTKIPTNCTGTSI